ncbi:MAG: hypothetical protein HFF74_02830 [Oscillospiraceae bacterium]|nr:hypothetical protein [Oscillospiraceae bacterium]
MEKRMSEKANKILYVVLSLLLAVIFWLYVDTANGNTMRRTFSNVPIDFIGAEDTLPSRGLMLSSGGDATLDLTLSGPRSIISNLRPGDIRAQVNLTGINAIGPYSLQWTLKTPDNVNNSDITVERSSRGTVSIQVTSLYSKDIPVSVTVTGNVQEPYVYMADRVVKEPAYVTLSGLQNNVDPVASARVVVDITDATDTIQQDYSYELLDADGNVLEVQEVRFSEQKVNVTVPIYMVKTLDLKPDFKESPGSRLSNVKWDLQPKTITVTGDPLSLETIDEINLGEVDLSTLYSDTVQELDIKLPAGCENSSGYKTTMLSIKFHGLSTRSFSVTNIQSIGTSESQRFDPITTVKDVVLRGPAEDLEQVTEEDIRIVVDLREITNDGTIQPPATVLVDGYSEVGAVGTYTVTGKIISR